MAGDPAAARDQLTELLPVMERVLGPEQPDTLVARDQLTAWIGVAGDPAAARDQSHRAAAGDGAGVRPGAPGTLTARASLAYFTGEAGDPAAARDQLTELLPVVERVFDPEHPEHPGRPRQPRPLDRAGEQWL